MADTSILFFSISLFIALGLLLIITLAWMRANKNIRDKEVEIRVKEAEIARKEGVIRDEKAKRRQVSISYLPKQIQTKVSCGQNIVCASKCN